MIRFETLLFEQFPSLKKTGVVTTNQLATIMSKMRSKVWPVWLMKNRVARGKFAIGKTSTAEAAETRAIF